MCIDCRAFRFTMLGTRSGHKTNIFIYIFSHRNIISIVLETKECKKQRKISRPRIIYQMWNDNEQHNFQKRNISIDNCSLAAMWNTTDSFRVAELDKSREKNHCKNFAIQMCAVVFFLMTKRKSNGSKLIYISSLISISLATRGKKYDRYTQGNIHRRSAALTRFHLLCCTPKSRFFAASSRVCEKV